MKFNLKNFGPGPAYVLKYARHKTSRYFFEIDIKRQGIAWTTDIEVAQIFKTEKSAEDFIKKYLSPRKVEILQVQ